MLLTLHPSYFLDVEALLQVFHADQIILDMHDSYVKQTYRSRCYIAAANGPLTLNIPIQHTSVDGTLFYKDVLIDQEQSWASLHLKSIASAYSNSPYFEFYEDDFRQLYKDIPTRLMDWNLKTMKWLLEQWQIPFNYKIAPTFTQDSKAHFLITAKKKVPVLPPYMQVFQEKHGFLQPLSGLDLLFNLGPSARIYLKQSKREL